LSQCVEKYKKKLIGTGELLPTGLGPKTFALPNTCMEYWYDTLTNSDMEANQLWQMW
jgi:hypothetical protein